MLVQILTQPKNALVRQYKTLFNYENVELEFSEEALLAIAQKALDQGTGARGLRGVMENLLRRTMYELPSQSDITRCTINEKVVLEQAAPDYEKSDVAKTAELTPLGFARSSAS